MRVEMSFLVSLSCARFAIMNLHVIRTHSMCGRNMITYTAIPILCINYANTVQSHSVYGKCG